jgi:hypothetical protein
MENSANAGLSFDLTKEQQEALKVIGGGLPVRLAGVVRDDKLLIDVVALNNGIVRVSDQPFNVPGMAPFIACNGPMPGQE